MIPFSSTLCRSPRMLFVSLLFVLLPVGLPAHPGAGIAVDRKGQVFFIDTGFGVWKIDTLGKLSALDGSRWHWMALDEQGQFATSDRHFGEWFERVNIPGSSSTLVSCSDYPVVVHSDGNLYYANTRQRPAQIVRRTPGGKESVLATLQRVTDEKEESTVWVTGLASGPDGALYVMEASAQTDYHVIWKISMDGALTRLAGGFVPRSGNKDRFRYASEDVKESYCRGLAVDERGVVYVAVTGQRSVLKISPRGEVTTILHSEELWSPTGVAVFRGEVYVLEYNHAGETRVGWVPRVRKVGRDGKITTLATVSRVEYNSKSK